MVKKINSLSSPSETEDWGTPYPEYNQVVQRKTQKTYKLNPTTLGYLQELTMATGNTSTAVIEMSVALMYRHFFGHTALRGQLSTSPSVSEVPSPAEPPSMNGYHLTSTEKPQTLQARREELGLSRTALAQLSSISEGTVRRFEAGRYRAEFIKAEMVAKLAHGLQWSEQAVAAALGAKHISA